MNLADIDINDHVVTTWTDGTEQHGLVVGHRGDLVMVRLYGDPDARPMHPGDLEPGGGS